MLIQVNKIIKENIVFDVDDYILKTTEKQLYKLYKKMSIASGEDMAEQYLLTFITNKMKNKNDYYLDEIFSRNRSMLYSAVNKYISERIQAHNEEDFDDKVEIVEEYNEEEESDGGDINV